jgi:hypothetical protein
VNALQRLRETLERALVNAKTRREEREIGQAVVELQESADFTEFHELHPTGSVKVPPEFSLPSPLTERGAVPPVLPRRL